MKKMHARITLLERDVVCSTITMRASQTPHVDCPESFTRDCIYYVYCRNKITIVACENYEIYFFFLIFNLV